MYKSDEEEEVANRAFYDSIESEVKALISPLRARSSSYTSCAYGAAENDLAWLHYAYLGDRGARRSCKIIAKLEVSLYR